MVHLHYQHCNHRQAIKSKLRGLEEAATARPSLLAVGETKHLTAWLRSVGVKRNTRVRARSADPPSWLTVVGWGSGSPHQNLPVVRRQWAVRGRLDSVHLSHRPEASQPLHHEMGRRISSIGRQSTGFSTTSLLPTPCFTSPSTMTTRRARCQMTAS